MSSELLPWPTAEGFYAQRDDRTNRAVNQVRPYWSRLVEVVIDPRYAGGLTAQRIGLVVANLSARWARRVHVRVDAKTPLDVDLRRKGWITLGERLTAEMTGADPYGTFTVSPMPLAGAEVLHCVISPCGLARVVDHSDIRVWASGWRAMIVTAECPDLPAARTATPAAAGLAASLAVAQLFKSALGQPHDRWLTNCTWNLWRQELTAGYPEASADEPKDCVLHFGRTLLAGAGAIGSAFVYLAAMGAPRGTLGLLDSDVVDATNLNRSPLFSVGDVLAGRTKVDAVAQYLTGTGVSVERFPGWWDDQVAAVERMQWDRWITLTNDHGAWTSLPFRRPPPLLHATTTSSWGFGVGRHAGPGDDCTRCRMPRRADVFHGPCSTGPIDEDGSGSEPPRAALPFLSTAAGALLLAECVRLQLDPTTVRPNQVTADLLWGLSAVIAVKRNPTPGCQGCDYLARIANLSTRPSAISQ